MLQFIPHSQNYIKADHHGPRGCYPAAPEQIEMMVREHFARAGFNLTMSDTSLRQMPPGILVPHLDFRVGGHVYPHGYYPLIGAEAPEQVIVLGVAHHAAVDVAVSRRGFSSPLGDLQPALDLYEALRGECSQEAFEVEECECFDGEHSIEFPLIYLQALGRIFPERRDFEVLNLVCGGMQNEIEVEDPRGTAYDEIGRAISRVLERSRKRILLIVSVDGAHVGPRFGAEDGVSERQLMDIRSADKDAFSVASLGNPDLFFETFLPTLNERNFDGVGALYIALRALEKRARFELSCYDQWFWPPDQSVVTLAAGVFWPAVG